MKALDLIGWVSPICLLKFQQAMELLECDCRLEVSIQDPDVLADIRRLIAHAGHQIDAVHHDPDRIRVVVQKRRQPT
ncbi:MAG: sulfurtransferase TusA family protein [Desulfobacterales bacterium]